MDPTEPLQDMPIQRTPSNPSIYTSLPLFVVTNHLLLLVCFPGPGQVENLAGEAAVAIVVSTYTDATPPESAVWFAQWLSESATDFRVGLGVFNELRFGVFGCGNLLYGDNFNAVAKAMDRQLGELGAKRAMPVGLGNEDSNDMEAQFDGWSHELLASLQGDDGADTCFPALLFALPPPLTPAA